MNRHRAVFVFLWSEVGSQGLRLADLNLVLINAHLVAWESFHYTKASAKNTSYAIALSLDSTHGMWSKDET